MSVRRLNHEAHGGICCVWKISDFAPKWLEASYTRPKAEVYAAGCVVGVQCGADSHRNGLRVGESLTRVVVVPEAQVLQEW